MGKAVELNPKAIQAMDAAGHEIASHSIPSSDVDYRWIDYSSLTEEQEREHIRATVKAIQDATGTAPRGELLVLKARLVHWKNLR